MIIFKFCIGTDIDILVRKDRKVKEGKHLVNNNRH